MKAVVAISVRETEQREDMFHFSSGAQCTCRPFASLSLSRKVLVLKI
jgi:hypothetical protein